MIVELWVKYPPRGVSPVAELGTFFGGVGGGN